MIVGAVHGPAFDRKEFQVVHHDDPTSKANDKYIEVRKAYAKRIKERKKRAQGKRKPTHHRK